MLNYVQFYTKHNNFTSLGLSDILGHVLLMETQNKWR